MKVSNEGGTFGNLVVYPQLIHDEFAMDGTLMSLGWTRTYYI